MKLFNFNSCIFLIIRIVLIEFEKFIRNLSRMLVLVKFLYMYVFFVYIIRIVSFGFVNKNILIERIYYIKSFLILLYFFVIDKN